MFREFIARLVYGNEIAVLEALIAQKDEIILWQRNQLRQSRKNDYRNKKGQYAKRPK